MGIIKALKDAASGSLADQWLEVIEPGYMDDNTVMTAGVMVRSGDRAGANRSGTASIVSNGSVIHVYPNQFMLLVDGGKVVDFTAEEGYYTVNDASAPSLFHGEFGETLMHSLDRIRFGGVTPVSQKVYYINLQEIKGIKFGTRNPINYFDQFYNAELFLRAHGVYSIKVTDPLLFYAEVIPRSSENVQITSINEQYFAEFMEALQSAVNQMSADGDRVSFVTSKGRELGKYMSTILDEDWKKMRGFIVQSVGISSISYDDQSQKLINMRNEAAMLSDPNLRETYVQKQMADGVKAAGSNAAGAMTGFLGMGMGMQQGGAMASAFTQTNQQQVHQQQEAERAKAAATAAQGGWACVCGVRNAESVKFCGSCGQKRPASGWVCSCGANNLEGAKFCGECGKKRAGGIKCDKCGFEIAAGAAAPKFCPECGDPINEADMA